MLFVKQVISSLRLKRFYWRSSMSTYRSPRMLKPITQTGTNWRNRGKLQLLILQPLKIAHVRLLPLPRQKQTRRPSSHVSWFEGENRSISSSDSIDRLTVRKMTSDSSSTSVTPLYLT